MQRDKSFHIAPSTSTGDGYRAKRRVIRRKGKYDTFSVREAEIGNLFGEEEREDSKSRRNKLFNKNFRHVRA